MKARLRKINALLKKRYGVPPRQEALPDPLDILIGAILSQNTNDKNSFRAWENLRETCPDWEQVAALTPKELEKIIQVAGLGKQKSKAILGALRAIKEKYGEYSLDELSTRKEAEILEELTSLDGVGVKTASCVLLFSLDKNYSPVDTHVHRALNRIGVVDTKAPDKTFALINANMPKGVAHQLHTNLIRVGREYCRPATTDCAHCPALSVCEYPEKDHSGDGSVKENDFFLLDSIAARDGK